MISWSSSRLARAAFVLVALALCAYGLVSRWAEIGHALARLSAWTVTGALGAGLAGLGASMLAWRALLAGLGSPLPVPAAIRVMFLAQLGKYVPGSVWALVGQVELAREHDVPRRHGAGATLLAMAVTIATGCAVAAVTLPLTSAEATRRYWWLLLLAPALAACLHPRVIVALLDRTLAFARRPPVTGAVPLGAMARAAGWSLLAWCLFGAHAWLLTRSLGDAGFFLSTGAYALAFTAGFLVVIAPGGLGAREAALVIALAPGLPGGGPLVVALASRVVLTVADLLWAAVAVALRRTAPRAGSVRAGGAAPTGPAG
ncbi:lysylphosphatidylglycerol synthase domain-containing protein [Actinomadura sp. HBU206391]|uniref:lysylphosphatidylglycerol synthase domain-containing protein n=1 Tax=Actinomadura sp. HBU206391 TaxID=2731692 RepID=UPI001650BF4D|nr:lysylphosphatidylglycerol synthase domain-containing protein [Actinomadura sp. HBU206391]MBC6456741.1 flippase-like domain-containing protein [Actinomadura sp. HBU206391]